MITRMLLLTTVSSLFSAAFLEADETATYPSSVGEKQNTHRSIAELRTEMRAALREEAVTRRAGENPAEVLRLIEIYQELAVHPDRLESAILKQMGIRLRSRLKRVGIHIERQISAPLRSGKKDNISVELKPEQDQLLAQQIGRPRAGANRPRVDIAQPPPPIGIPNDYGPELVELIQRTISPATWDINGGNGAVVYYAPRRVLVVSAPTLVHERVGALLGELRDER